MSHHTLLVTVDNRPGVLQRVAGLLRRRSFAVSWLTVAKTEDPACMRLTVAVDTRGTPTRLVTENLYKLVEVRAIETLSGEATAARELVLLRVRADSATRAEVLQLGQLHGARLVEVLPNSLVLEMSGASAEVSRLVALLRPFGILAMTRTGALGLPAATAEWATGEAESEPLTARSLRVTPRTGYSRPLAAREGA